MSSEKKRKQASKKLKLAEHNEYLKQQGIETIKEIRDSKPEKNPSVFGDSSSDEEWERIMIIALKFQNYFKKQFLQKSLYDFLKEHHLTFDEFLNTAFNTSTKYKKIIQKFFKITDDQVFSLGNTTTFDWSRIFGINEGPKKTVEQHLSNQTYGDDGKDLIVKPNVNIHFQTLPVYDWTNSEGTEHTNFNTPQLLRCQATVHYKFNFYLTKGGWGSLEKRVQHVNAFLENKINEQQQANIYKTLTELLNKYDGVNYSYFQIKLILLQGGQEIKLRQKAIYSMSDNNNNLELSKQVFTVERLNAFEEQVTEIITGHFAALSKFLFPPSNTATVTDLQQSLLSNHYKAQNDKIFSKDFFIHPELQDWVYGFSKLLLPSEEANMSSRISYENSIPAPENVRNIRDLVIKSIERNMNTNTLKIDLKPQWFRPHYHAHDRYWPRYLDEAADYNLFTFSSRFTPIWQRRVRLPDIFLKFNIPIRLSNSIEILKFTQDTVLKF